MKKFLTLVLALVLVFGLSVPAMAFTSDSSEDVDHPYDLSIYLVEYDDNDLFGLIALPESDRGYAKNEIVAAVVELFVPKNESIKTAEYATLVFGGDNVDLDVTDNYVSNVLKLETTSNITIGTEVDAAAWDSADKDEIIYGINTLDGKDTYKWLFFAKVTDDDASLYAKLIDGTGTNGFTGNYLNVVLDGDTYLIVKDKASSSVEGDYTIYCDYKDLGTAGVDTTDDTYEDAIRIYVDKNNKSTGMAIADDTAAQTYAVLNDTDFTPLGVNTSGELGIVVGATIDTDGDTYDDIMDIYDDIVVDVFGMDYFLIGNYVRDSFFEDLVSADTIVATVDIEPWTAYVTVPDNIVVDPPKTGDAASIMGFVMVALSGAGAVALKKRG